MAAAEMVAVRATVVVGSVKSKLVHPCSRYGDPIKPCTCSQATISRYQHKVSGPRLDRIDIHLEVTRVDYEKLTDARAGERSEVIRLRVQAARDRQAYRFKGMGLTCNADTWVWPTCGCIAHWTTLGGR